MILNGVCVIWKGWIDLQRLDGMGCLEFDEERAQVRQPAHMPRPFALLQGVVWSGSEHVLVCLLSAFTCSTNPQEKFRMEKFRQMWL